MKTTSSIGIFSSLIPLLMLLYTWCAQADTVVNELPRGNLAVCKVAATSDIYPCSIGKGGIRIDKKEGDGATPAGSFFIRKIFYRVDKLTPKEIKRLNKLQAKGFSVQALTEDDGWVDDVKSPDYNKFVKISALPSKNISHENLWRKDDVYDIIAVIGYNDNPVVKGKGSAIFMHVVRLSPTGDFGPTVGCVAFMKPDLLKVLTAITPKTRINIATSGEIVLN